MSHVASEAVAKTQAVLLSCGTRDYPCCCHVGHVTSYLDAAKIRKVSESWCNGRDFFDYPQSYQQIRCFRGNILKETVG